MVNHLKKQLKIKTEEEGFGFRNALVEMHWKNRGSGVVEIVLNQVHIYYL